MLIRNEQFKDRLAIRNLLLAAFPQKGEADLVDQLRADGDSVLSLVALEDETVLGRVLFSRLDAPFRALGLAPVAVTPLRQRSGIGSALIRAGLEQVALGGWQAVFVLGSPSFYTRFGFDVSPASGFNSPYTGPHFMALPIGAAMPATTGNIKHAPAFQSLV